MTSLPPNRPRANADDPDRFTTIVWNNKLNRPCLCTTYDIIWAFDSNEEKDNDNKLFTCTKIDFPLIVNEGEIKPIQVNFKIKTAKIDISLLVPKLYYPNWVPTRLKSSILKNDIFNKNVKKCMLNHILKVESDLESSNEYNRIQWRFYTPVTDWQQTLVSSVYAYVEPM